YPPFLRFSYVIPSKFKDLDLILVARNFDLRIDSLKLLNPHFKIVFGNIKSPMILPKDSAHRITIRFTPTDSSIVFDSLVIYSDACKIRKVNITGGFPNKKPNEKTLTILSPKCGDYYFLGDTIFIQWEGVLPTDVVQLQYSTNGGESWDTLAVNVLGLGYKFFVNPKKFKESDSCLIRVIQIWPNNAGETIELRHKSAINSANFNRDASLIVTATNHPDEFATVWNPGTGKKLFELKGHTKQVNWATFDLLDRYIITASDDSTSILYDIKSGDSLHTFKAHNGKVTSANFSPDGNYLVTSGLDGKCFIWDLRNYNLVYTISTGINPIYFASFTPDTNFVAYASYDGNIYLFDIKQLKVVKTFSTKFGNNHIHHFSIHPEIKKLAAASHLGLIFIFNYDPSDTTTKVYPSFVLAHDTISYPAINTTYFNSNGSWLISAGSDARVLRWNPSTGELIDSIAIGEHSNSVTTAQFSFDDAMLLTSSWDTTAKIFNRTKLGLQIDTTDCLFSIISPQVIANDVDLGAAFIGYSKDTLVAPILINQSKAKVE
ncbi:MAG: WD40 repeat domain-containing protein, partial [Candidatus Kapaibacteriota bacterium]